MTSSREVAQKRHICYICSNNSKALSLHGRMDHLIRIPLLPKTILNICFFFFFFTTLPQSLCQQQFTNYSVCSQPYDCGNVSNIYYPFWGQNRPNYCGGGEQFKLDCDEGQHTSLQLGNQNFKVLEINTTTYTMTMERTDLGIDVCSPQFGDTYLSPSLFRYPTTMVNITIFYNCSSSDSIGGNTFTCPHDGNQIAFYVGEVETLLNQFPGLHGCGYHIQVPAFQGVRLEPRDGIDDLYQALADGFAVNYILADGEECLRCLGSKGACGTNDTANYQFSCYCPDGSGATLQCSAPSPGHSIMPSGPSSEHNKGNMQNSESFSSRKHRRCPYHISFPFSLIRWVRRQGECRNLQSC